MAVDAFIASYRAKTIRFRKLSSIILVPMLLFYRNYYLLGISTQTSYVFINLIVKRLTRRSWKQSKIFNEQHQQQPQRTVFIKQLLDILLRKGIKNTALCTSFLHFRGIKITYYKKAYLRIQCMNYQ